MDALQKLDEAISYFGYVVARSSKSAKQMRREIGPEAVAMEVRYQADLDEAMRNQREAE
jgi:head-tail adaptor